MSWPLSHEFNEAIQNPKVVFSDPDLKGGEPVVGATGLPLPRSGNFADVYQMRGADGRDWAVKCFTRPVVGLGERYARVSEALAKANLPFAVGFTFLAEGIRVGGEWRPIVKMEWVEGLLLNQVVRDNAGKPPVLNALSQMWVRLCKRLRDTGIAHADLQHGNVLLVPGSRPGAYGLKLIDYDGVYVPALANTPSGESGHPSFQHPARAATRAYSPDVDRFPHLVVATAVRGLTVGGTALWEKYDNGDNLLFTEEDYKKPAASKAMRELWQTENPAVQALVGRLALACGKPIPQTPWLDQFAPDGEPAILDDATRREAATALGIAVPVPIPLPPEPSAAPAPVPVPVAPIAAAVPPAPAEVPRADADLFAIPDEPTSADVELVQEPEIKATAKGRSRRAEVAAAKAKSPVPMLAAAGGVLLLVVGGLVAAVVMTRGKSKQEEIVQKPDDPAPVTPKPNPKEGGTPKVIPKEGGTPKDPPITDPPGAVYSVQQKWASPLPEDWKQIQGIRIGADSRTGEVHAGDGKLALFDAPSGMKLPNPPDAAGIMYGVHVLDGGLVANTWHTGAGALPVWNSRTEKAAEPLPRLLDAALHTEVSPNGRFHAAFLGHGGDPRTLKVADATTGKTVLDLKWTRGGVLFTADSSRVLVADASGRCQWFKLPSGEPDGEWMLGAGDIQNTAGTVAPVAMSGDGSRIVFDGSRLGAKHLFDGKTGKLVRRLNHDAGPNCLTTDGRLLLTTRPDATGRVAELTNSTTGEVLVKVPAPPGSTSQVFALTPDGSGIIVAFLAGGATERNGLFRYDIRGGSGPVPPMPSGPDPVATVLKPRWTVSATSADGKYLNFSHLADSAGSVLAGAPLSPLVAFDLKTGAPRAEFAGPNQVVQFFDLTPGRVGVRMAGPNNIHVLDEATGKEIEKITVPKVSYEGAAGVLMRPSPDTKYMAVGRTKAAKDADGNYPVQVFEMASAMPVLSTTWKNSGVFHFTADSARVLISEPTGRCRWFKVATGEPDGEWTFEGDPNNTLPHRVTAVSDDGSVLGYRGSLRSGSTTAHAAVVDGRTGKPIHLFAKDYHYGTSVSVSADGRRAALLRGVGASCAIDVTDARTGAVLGRAPVPGNRSVTPNFVLSRDGSVLHVHCADARTLSLFDVPAPSAVAVVPPKVEPVDTGALDVPPPGGVALLNSRWATSVGAGKAFDQLHYAPDANAVLLSSATGGFEALNTSGGTPRVGFTGLSTAGVTDFFALKDGRVGTVSAKSTEFKVWNGKAGVSAGKHPIPDPGPGAGAATALLAHLAPDEKHTVVARSAPRDGVWAEAPVKAFDATGKKQVFATTWTGGSVHFTADSARALVAEWSGKFRWFNLTSGEPGDAWNLEAPAGGRAHQITGTSADGAVLGYNGPASEKHRGPGPAVMDGKTGKLTRVFGRDYLAASPVEISADGKRAAVIKEVGRGTITIDVVDLTTGARHGRALVRYANGADTVPLFALAPDGKSLVVYDPGRQKVHLFDVPATLTKAP